MTRPTWDEYFMRIAVETSRRSTCSLGHSGAVIVKDKRILSTGYTGSIAGYSHCDSGNHIDGICNQVVHAEANAIIQAARNGVSTEGATIYSTSAPCWPCFKMLSNSGIRGILYADDESIDRKILDASEKLGLRIERLILDIH